MNKVRFNTVIDSIQAMQETYGAIIAFIEKYGPGEVIAQSDEAQIDAIELLCDIADNILKPTYVLDSQDDYIPSQDLKVTKVSNGGVVVIHYPSDRVFHCSKFKTTFQNREEALRELINYLK
jgi:effector-binding domain-containing protein